MQQRKNISKTCFNVFVLYITIDYLLKYIFALAFDFNKNFEKNRAFLVLFQVAF